MPVPKRFVKLIRPGLVGTHSYNAGDVVELDAHRAQLMIDAKAATPDVGPERRAVPDPASDAAQLRKAERADLHARIEKAERTVGVSAK